MFPSFSHSQAAANDPNILAMSIDFVDKSDSAVATDDAASKGQKKKKGKRKRKTEVSENAPDIVGDAVITINADKKTKKAAIHLPM